MNRITFLNKVSTKSASLKRSPLQTSYHCRINYNSMASEIKLIIQKRLDEYCQYCVDGNFEAVAGLFTADAKLVVPGVATVITGRSGILNAFKGSKRYTLKSAEVQKIEYAGQSDLAAHSTYKNYLGDKLVSSTKDITAWRKVNNQWFMYLDVYTDDPPSHYEEVQSATKQLSDAFNNGLVQEISQLYSAQCLIMRQNQTKKIGQESCVEYYTSLLTNLAVVKLEEIIDNVHSISDDIIHVIGTSSFYASNDRLIEKLKFVRLWKRIQGKLVIEWDNANPA